MAYFLTYVSIRAVIKHIITEAAMFTPSSDDPYETLVHHLLQQIKSAARAYFEDLFRKEQKTILEFSTSNKLDGRHVGLLLSINYLAHSDNIQRSITYYIKVHNLGPQWEDISKFNPPDPREILIYNVLSLTGYGAKVHFFFSPDNQDILCIATQDVSFTKRQHREKTFIAGSSKEFSELLVKHKQPIVKLLNTVEILQHLLLLGDILEHTENIGVVITPESLKMKIIDFSINIPKEPERLTLRSGLSETYITKNNTLHYDRHIQHDLYYQDNIERKQNEKLCQQEFITGKPRLSSHEPHMPLVIAINTAQEITENFLDCSQNFLYYVHLISSNLQYFLSLHD